MLHKISIISILLIITGVTAVFAQTPSAQTVAAVSADARDDRYRIGYQDVLNIQVFRHPELGIEATVNPNGMIYLFRLEEPIVAVCKTERELARDIENAYKVKYLKNPQVNVIVRESGPNKESGTRVMVARTGSTSNCRMPDSVVSDDVTVLGFKMREIQEGKRMLWMQPGDIVSVLDADMVYVYGNVIKPGEVKFREPITLRQAIASSQGLKPATDKSVVRVLRQIPDSIERKELIYNLSEIDKGRGSDPYLEPNDIVAVSKDSTKAILNGVVTTFTNGLPTILSRGIPIP
ncbi:MAG: polysaccharide biosynthesis/export family protein [Chloracidobacterium sp.]|nr:polysaccharide biosynthesis/export family protein [Chloracidobacterium sp.]